MANIGEWYSDGYRHYQVVDSEEFDATVVRLRARYTNERFLVPLERLRKLRGPVPARSIGAYVP